jgi:hypothetical protein
MVDSSPAAWHSEGILPITVTMEDTASRPLLDHESKKVSYCYISVKLAIAAKFS